MTGKPLKGPKPTRPSKMVASKRATRNLDSPTTSLTPVAEKSPEPLTPYQRMQEILSAKAAVEEHGPILVDTVKGLKTHLQDHTYEQWQLIRMHFVDARAPEPLEKILRVFQSGSELLPRPGTVVNIDEYSHLQLYRDLQCQLPTRLSQLNWERSNLREQMTKHRGSTNYEMHCLLNLIRKHLPVASAEWEAVSALYNATKEPQWKARNGASLKRKFCSMCIASKLGGTELVSATIWVQSMMTMKKRGEAKQEPSRCSTNEPLDTRRVPLDVP
ncbi:hypothetical protein PC118_g18833 [Phytophthora cactorum]|uniref:DUF6818 domain-containing protein n=2 Tax=Phytophthora cactorum TaxID=29920 RepID=A0A8T1F7D6_9STRA|nr:hypothetical protein PC118_g18833 [Phytophthora cactorum]